MPKQTHASPANHGGGQKLVHLLAGLGRVLTLLSGNQLQAVQTSCNDCPGCIGMDVMTALINDDRSWMRSTATCQLVLGHMQNNMQQSNSTTTAVFLFLPATLVSTRTERSIWYLPHITGAPGTRLLRRSRAVALHPTPLWVTHPCLASHQSSFVLLVAPIAHYTLRPALARPPRFCCHRRLRRRSRPGQRTHLGNIRGDHRLPRVAALSA